MALTHATQRFADFTQDDLLLYVFGAHLLRSIVFGSQSRRIAQEINNGTFSLYLVRPVNHFWFFYFCELAERLILTFTAIIEIIILGFVLHLNLFSSLSFQSGMVFLSIILAHFLYYLLSYAFSLLAFWSREAMGPRFLFEWFLEFASGAYFPLHIVGQLFFSFLSFLPFMYLIYTPLMILLGKIEEGRGVLLQLMWIGVSVLLCVFIWRQGLEKYSGEGI